MGTTPAPTAYWAIWKGTRVGVVHRRVDGWIFVPFYQRKPSRKSWATPEAAVNRRLPGCTLEPM
jgi:hypothetical protein